MQQGLTEEMYSHVHEYADSGDYSERERLAIESVSYTHLTLPTTPYV